ncbi:hypothetical protein ACT3SP_15160 [Brachybacterium sp. AOP43-C2-M15]|uniref:hypothetical protein n=1 Tax=Brachybacterium sp. AOP43-C2-M15 TaxID=3457661 RepID=UPI004034B299
MSELFSDPAPDDARERRSPRWVRWSGFLAGALVLIVLTAVVTLGVTRPNTPTPDPGDSGSETAEPHNDVPLAFGAQDTVVATTTVPAGPSRSHLLQFDVAVGATPTATPRAAMVGLRVECHDESGRVEMQAKGNQTTNMFVSKGGSMSGQALSPETDQELRCDLLASAPYIEVEEDGHSSLPLTAELRVEPTDGAHHLALHRLDDATLVREGRTVNVLSRQIDEPRDLERMSTTLRLTSCTVVGGSRDRGPNRCTASMTGEESSTVRVKVIGRWLDDEGEIRSASTYWDEVLAIDYDTHHVPWTLRQDAMGDMVPEDASSMVLVVQVESIAGTPFVVHADGSDSVITTVPRGS